MPSLQVSAQCGVKLRESAGEGLAGAEHVPELKDLCSIRLPSPVRLRC